MRVAIHQPQYWPWPLYMHKMLTSDVFVYLDSVQFTKNGIQNRNQVKSANGVAWLTLPVQQRLGQSIAETRVAGRNALEKHSKTLFSAYGRTPGFQRWKDEIQALFATPGDSLATIAIRTTEWMFEKLGGTAQRLRSSEMAVDGKATDLVTRICSVTGASEYLSGRGALAYMEVKQFAGIGCRVMIQTWEPFVYPQVHPQLGFIADLSTLDLLLNAPDDARDLILRAGSWKEHAV